MVKLDKVTLLFSNRRDSFQPKTLYARIQRSSSSNDSIERRRGDEKLIESNAFNEHWIRITSPSAVCVEKLRKKHPLIVRSVRVFVQRRSVLHIAIAQK